MGGGGLRSTINNNNSCINNSNPPEERHHSYLNSSKIFIHKLNPHPLEVDRFTYRPVHTHSLSFEQEKKFILCFQSSNVVTFSFTPLAF